MQNDIWGALCYDRNQLQVIHVSGRCGHERFFFWGGGVLKQQQIQDLAVPIQVYQHALIEVLSQDTFLLSINK
jgi:hypothetical protein